MVAVSTVFLVPGLLSSLVLVFYVLRARTSMQRGLTVAGYVISLPVALVGSLSGGLVLTPLLGATLYGVILSSIGTGVGYALGAAMRRTT
jgi:hypothetical protein